ncbi:cerato-platanin-like protein [Punctularia strigosozonata HHB-11173 SS5]|uniref:cerato-platanin-like protein n=1 Tax=Punctularia strigosozonata (strain HHB-11173) TaxID=741275 RepID=UPI00044174E0|nr:cerato-platanin-like protein [Punctularia strigosozonata HHB-11173 SS5]EIN07862.1 cerato-platanin-like protein [Punctularia strigosozonata HHB-11173 SS5]
MKYAAVLSSLLSGALAVQLSFDPVYDNKNGSMDTVECSTGSNGLITRFGFKTFGDLPSFPNIGGAQAVEGFNSAACGSCFNLTFAQTGKTITVLAIDHADSGFNVGQVAMDDLTNGQAVQLGIVQVNATQVPGTACGLPA